jgi:hypothetical protein
MYNHDKNEKEFVISFDAKSQPGTGEPIVVIFHITWGESQLLE